MTEDYVLIVEDNPLNTKLLRDVLVANGYRVEEATTAEAGLEQARSAPPRLILMDIHLPGMDGIAALRILKDRAETRAIPVIAVTASAMPAERSEIIAAGFDGYQSKPISVKDLLGEIRGLIGDERSAP